MVGFACIANLAVVAAAIASNPSPSSGSSTNDGGLSLVELAQMLGGLFLLPYLASAVAFLVWIYRARSRQKWFASRTRPAAVPGSEPDISPSRSVLGWFIPVANLFIPYEEVSDLFQREGTAPGDRPPLLKLWWGTFIASGFAAAFFQVYVRPWKSIPGASNGVLWLFGLRFALFAVAAFLCARWIAEFEHRTRRRVSDRVAASPPATAPPTPPPR